MIEIDEIHDRLEDLEEETELFIPDSSTWDDVIKRIEKVERNLRITIVGLGLVFVLLIIFR